MQSFSAVHNAEDVLASYRALDPLYDEMWASAPFHNEPREHWRACVERLQAWRRGELELRQKDIQRFLRENGVTYSVYSEPNGLHRAWSLNPLPFIVGEHDWAAIESGLQQRVELLNLLLADLYGEQRLLKDKVIPPELIYAHQGFLYPCAGVSFPTPEARVRRLRLYAADLARGPDNRMWALSDRAQAPSGAGYALENRAAMLRAMPDMFAALRARGFRVRRIAPFFQSLQESLEAIAPPRVSSEPRIVVLTPGPDNETHFEHAYLASSLGYDLVQGEDLTVRNGFLYLKSLSGLQRVDVVLRRVDDSYCDPLELDSHSRLGVAGMMEVVRRGNLAMANPLGSGILENPGLMAFLPSVARYFLDEDLEIPSAATWWCGGERERRFVLENLDSLIIKPIYRGLQSETIYGRELSSAELEALRRRIEEKPYNFVGQEYVNFSTTPSFTGDGIEPRYAVVRTYLAALGDSYVVMPGGLTRAARERDMFLVSNQAGGVSKDTWALARDLERPLRVQTPNQPSESERADDSPANGQTLFAQTSDKFKKSKEFQTFQEPGKSSQEAEARRGAGEIHQERAQQDDAADPSLEALEALRRSSSPRGFSVALSSRVAECLFWVGRYAERAQTAARLFRLIFQRQHESLTLRRTLLGDDLSFASARAEADSERQAFCVALQTLTHSTLTYPGFVGDGAQERLARPDEELRAILLDPARVGSVAFTLQALFRNLYAARERFSGDTWRVVGALERDWNVLRNADEESLFRRAETTLDAIVSSVAALWGLNGESMGYDEGWLLLDAGRRLERALQMTSLARSMFSRRAGEATERLLMEYAAEMSESQMTYRSRFRSHLHLPALLDLLLLDPTNPRSLLYQLERLQRRLEDFPRAPETSARFFAATTVESRLSEQERLLLQSLTRARLAEPSALVAVGEDGFRASLDELLGEIFTAISAAALAITQQYFRHATPQRQM
jgi:uncharacterized circularly permuted ATP-grasp superfamily protein/uncharacterized alpha-E superfamily protein